MSAPPFTSYVRVIPQWEPIETAPRDEIVDIWVRYIHRSEPPGHRVINCYWDGPRDAPPSIGADDWIGWTYDDETAHRSYPVEGHGEVATHWMRPPGPPAP